jgi:hypothetical protein
VSPLHFLHFLEYVSLFEDEMIIFVIWNIVNYLKMKLNVFHYSGGASLIPAQGSHPLLVSAKLNQIQMNQMMNQTMIYSINQQGRRTPRDQWMGPAPAYQLH